MDVSSAKLSLSILDVSFMDRVSYYLLELILIMFSYIYIFRQSNFFCSTPTQLVRF